MFDYEINWTLNSISLEETQRKRQELKWSIWSDKINLLIKKLELNIEQRFYDYFSKLKTYFEAYIDLIVFKAQKGYERNDQQINVYIEESFSLIKKGITAFRVSPDISLKYGFYIIAGYGFTRFIKRIFSSNSNSKKIKGKINKPKNNKNFEISESMCFKETRNCYIKNFNTDSKSCQTF